MTLSGSTARTSELPAWLDGEALRQMGGLPPDALDVLVRTMARICENPYDRLFSMAMRDEDPQERMAELGDTGFIQFTVDEAVGLVRVYDLVWLGCCLQVRHGGLAVEIGDYEPAEQAGVGAAGADDLDRGLGVLGYLGQVVELAAHDLAGADGAVQDALVEDAPELGRARSVQNCLAGQAGGYLLV